MLRTDDLRASVIELSRGPCFGNCPVYTVTISGAGDVEFEGKEWLFEGNKRVEGDDKQVAKITAEEFASVIAALNRAHFSDLDDRAFSWCFDTPTVAVTVSNGAWTRRVASDSYCAGARSGVQARFVEAAADIEKIVGTDRWVLCNGHRCR
jgi:hypothetical protein